MNGMTTAQAWREKEKKEADERHMPYIEAYKSGMTIREVADAFDLSFQRVGHIVKRAKDRGLLDDD